MTWSQDMRYIVLPLATRVSLPAWIRSDVGCDKDSALVLWLGLIELLRASQILVTRLQEPLTFLMILRRPSTSLSASPSPVSAGISKDVVPQ